MGENLFKKQSREMKEKEVNGNVLEPEVVMTEVSLGVFKNPVNGQWCLAKVGFNPLFNKSGEPEVIYTAIARAEVIEQFKIMAAKLGIIG